METLLDKPRLDGKDKTVTEKERPNGKDEIGPLRYNTLE
jgi:hypothetical protein